MDSIERYLYVFDALRRRKRWTTDTNVLRFATLTQAASDMADPGPPKPTHLWRQGEIR